MQIKMIPQKQKTLFMHAAPNGLSIKEKQDAPRLTWNIKSDKT